MSSRGKRYGELLAKVDREREYEPAEALALVRSLTSAKFDETVEMHVRTGLNVRHADEQLRGTIALPNGIGKDVKIAVFAQGDAAAEAEQAGADYVGGEDLGDANGATRRAGAGQARPAGQPNGGRHAAQEGQGQANIEP